MIFLECAEITKAFVIRVCIVKNIRIYLNKA